MSNDKDLLQAVIKATEIAERAHEGQVDKSGEPYLNHIYAVASSAQDFIWNGSYRNIFELNDLYPEADKVNFLATLHDVMEDHPKYTEELKALCDKLDDPSLFHDLILLTRGGGQQYSYYIEAISTSKRATIVKIADLKHNMDITRLKELREEDFKRLQKYHRSYRTLLKALKEMN